MRRRDVLRNFSGGWLGNSKVWLGILVAVAIGAGLAALGRGIPATAKIDGSIQPASAVPSPTPDPAVGGAPGSRPRAGVRPRFVDVAELSGIQFSYFSSAQPERFFLPEIMGGGAAWVDFTGDGWLGLYLVNGCELPRRADDPHIGRLYRNDHGHFIDVTRPAGLGWSQGYGQGTAVGDYNNDGFPDLYLAQYGSNRLKRNNGDGTWTDVTAEARLDHHGWSTGCAFGDLDRDGNLDLYVADYARTTLATSPQCFYTDNGKQVRGYCGPTYYEPEPHVLYHNRGDGTFAEVTRAAGCAVNTGRGLGVLIADLDNDGWPDIFVANDMTANYLFHNLKAGAEAHGPRFEEVALARGAALMGSGIAGANMGIACGDYRGDGWLDLYVSHYLHEGNTLYRNFGGRFMDVSGPARLTAPSLPYLGFGTGFLDYDLDGWLDLFVTNGHVLGPNLEPNLMRPQLYHNTGHGQFTEVTNRAGPYFFDQYLGRGAGFADFNNDGAAGVLVTHVDHPPALLRNDTRPRGHFIGLACVGTRSNRTALGARVRITAGGRTQTFEIFGGGSYLCSSDQRVLAGLGGVARADRVEVRWPSGRVDHWTDLKADQYWRLVEGHAPRPILQERSGPEPGRQP